MKHIWIIGFGKFGAHAARQVLMREPGAGITAVDPDPARLAPWKDRIRTVQADGVAFVVEQLARGQLPDTIVAALPVHLAYEWLLQTVQAIRPVEPVAVPAPVIDRLPHPIIGTGGVVYASHADFLCPDTCAEPAAVCSVTRRARPVDMFRLIREITCGVTPVVVRSRQLAPGVGGYPPEALFAAASRIEHLFGDVLLATACRCHAVVHALRLP